MPLANDTANTIGDIFIEVSTTLHDAGLKWFSTNDINNSIQDQYNKIVALLCPIEKSTLIPFIASPYYNMRSIQDFMYLSAIYNPQINSWLRGFPNKDFNRNYFTFQNIGNSRYYNILDLNKIVIWPYLNPAKGLFYIIYKAKAPTISNNHIPLLPYSVGSQILEYATIADLLEQAREFKKAAGWWDRLFKPIGTNKKSIFQQAKDEIKSLARYDREMVLEPYRWIFHTGGQTDVSLNVDNEVPLGTINGVNANFTIAQLPNPVSSLLLTRNGQIQVIGEAYTLAGTVITFNTNFIPQNNDVLRAWYRIT